ncbi:CGNR zinc finger domain-containing protein [Yinghuangia aomiensis]|uniref:CGNR zinc finger domain-containing protein n=1 Tax=Yinghuangia aomiensis TaxID=676205 RepID=A0ABP9HSL7_9ACTN
MSEHDRATDTGPGTGTPAATPAATPPAASEDAAPGALRLVEDFVNTLSVETGTEALTDPAALAAWLTTYGLLPDGAPAGQAGLDRARIVREGLRALLADHNAARPALEEHDGDPYAPALAALASTARELPLVFDPYADPPRLAPATSGTVDAALARLLGHVAEAAAAGTWVRMKACRMCAWAYYDHSRNRSRAWCSMALCGNRAKAKAFRDRTR